jgi:pilus assembly protein CpaB
MLFRRRPSRSTVVFLVAAAVCAFAAFSLMRGYAARLDALRPALGPTVPVLVAARDVARGATLTTPDLEVLELPEAVAPPGALRETTHAVGRTTLTALAPGEAVTSTRLVGGDGGTLASLVPPGLRAVPIEVATVPDGLVVGDRIDVVATYGEGRMYAETVGHELELLVAPGAGDDGAAAIGGQGDGTQLVVLADATTASRLARSSVASVLSIAVVGIDDG